MAERKSNKLFEQLENLYTKDEKVTTNTKPESIYMINRFLSLSVRGFLAATECNSAPKIPERAKLPFLFYTIKKGYLPKMNYPKAEKEQLTPRRKKALLRICQKFCVRDYHGMQIMLLLEQQGIKVESD